MIIGLIGEDPNDTRSIENLLSPLLEGVTFVTLLKRINGSQLDQQITKQFLRIELQSHKPDYVIAIRDLDSHENDFEKKNKVNKFFISIRRMTKSTSLKLLNIYEIEALILSDISTFNRIYNTEIVLEDLPHAIEGPKEFLKKKTNNKYNESHNPDIFKQLDIEQIKGNCSYFSKFIKNLDKLLIS